MKAVRAVLDTNVVVSALLFGGPPKRVLSLVLTGHIDWLTSPFLIDEFRRVMRLKFPNREAASIQTLDEFSSFWWMVPALPIPRVSVIAKDPDDDHVLECALAGEAECIVSGDKHLIKLKRYCGITILNPQQFLRNYGF